MPLLILDPATTAAVDAAATTQEAHRDALQARWAGGNVTVRLMAGSAIAEVCTYGPWVPNTNTPRGMTLGPLLASSVLLTGATITSVVYVAAGVAIFSQPVDDYTLDLPTTLDGRRTSLADAVLPGVEITAHSSLPLAETPPPLTYLLTFALADVATVGVAISGSIVNTGTGACAWSITPPAHVSVTPSSGTLAAGGTQSLSVEIDEAGTYDLTLVSSGTTITGATQTVVASEPVLPGLFAWSINDNDTLSTGRNTVTEIATDVPTGATCYASPDLLPGQSLVLAGGTLSIVGDATVPTVDGSSSGSALDIISARDVVIEVIEDPAIATIVNVTQSITYPYSTDYTGRTGLYPVNRWNAVMVEADPGDVIEISPGYVQGQDTDASNYFSSNLDSAMLAVWKPCTIRNMAGRGRWKLREGTGWLSSGRSGIIIYAPAEIGARGSFVIEGFDTDNFGVDGFGVRVRNDTKTPGVYTYMHADVTLRNFKIGRPSGYRSLSGVSALAEVLTLEDGHIYDTGSSSGLNHNLYIGAKTMALRGLRLERTRGWTGTPWAGGTCDLDGHLAKLHAADGVIEGCAFVCGPTSGPSELIQMYAGGNWTVSGCVFVDTPFPNNANGAVTMVREYQTSGPPNFDWYAGINGNSLVFERNAWVGHYPRPIIWFFTSAVSADEALYASGDTSVDPERRLSALTVRDNIAIVTSTSAPYMLSGFPGSGNAMWINNDPNAGGNWAARGNTARAYNAGAWAFNDRELLLHTDALGAPAASTGSQSVPQFLWPHGHRTVTRSTQGLG